MTELIKAGIGLLVQLTVFFACGSLFMKIVKMKQEASLAVIIGYLLYFSVFEVVAIPVTLLWVPLRTFSVGWGVFSGVMVILAAVFLWKQWKKQIQGVPDIWEEHSWMFALAAAVILLQCLIVALYQDTTVDATYYVGTVSASVYTGTINRYNPYTGVILSKFPARYIFSAYPTHNAVWCDLLGVHPIVQAKVVMSMINVLVSNLIIYQIGKRLFDNEKKKADLMVCFVCLLQLFSYTIYTPGTFFFTRAYEGKALLANVAIPAVLYCCIWFWQKSEANMWVVLFLVSLSAVAFSGSSIILAAAIGVGILPTIFMRKEFLKLIPLGICMIPEFAYLLLYYSAKLGWIVLNAS